MINIRSKVFETNSSSTHSIAIADDTDGILDTLIPDDNGVIVLSGGEFGWSWDKFNDAYTKANYCAVDAAKDPAKIRMLIDAIIQHTGAKKVSINIDSNSDIDHQSVGTSAPTFADLDVLINFIFNPKSWLFTGNDNERTPPNFYDIDNINYNYILSIDDLARSVKFVSMPEEEKLKESLQTLCQYHPCCQWNDSDVSDVNDDSFDEEYGAPFRVFDWDHKSYDGSVLSSWSLLKDNMVILYKTKDVYSEDIERKFLGEMVTDSKQIKFSIKQVS